MLTGSGQFIFLYGLENAMKATPVDHFGFVVESEGQLNEILEKAKQYKKSDGDVVIVDKAITSYDIDESILDRMPGKQVDLINCYIGYRMPLAVEIQYYRWNS
jgi:acyl CoA:acetate/3-ketoacid CoA transferase